MTLISLTAGPADPEGENFLRTVSAKKRGTFHQDIRSVVPGEWQYGMRRAQQQVSICKPCVRYVLAVDTDTHSVCRLARAWYILTYLQ